MLSIFEKYAHQKNADTRQLITKATSTRIEQFGVVGNTVFTFLPYLDVIGSFPPDYMHSVLLGIMKQLYGLWTESEHHRETFYIGNRLKVIESRILIFDHRLLFPGARDN